jgi:hypothetical protein
MKIHTLANGAKLVHLSKHKFKFSDGTEAEGQVGELVDKFTLSKEFKVLRQIHGMNVTRTKMVLSKDQVNSLAQIADSVDILLVSFQLLQAICDSGYHIGNVVAFNSTPETARSAPDEKIVDINNWSGLV